MALVRRQMIEHIIGSVEPLPLVIFGLSAVLSGRPDHAVLAMIPTGGAGGTSGGCIRLRRGGRRQRRLRPRGAAVGRSAEPGAPAGSRPGQRTRHYGGTAGVADAD